MDSPKPDHNNSRSGRLNSCHQRGGLSRPERSPSCLTFRADISLNSVTSVFCISPELFNEGYVTAATYLWAEGQAEWSPLSAIPELSSALTSGGASTSAAEPPIAGARSRGGQAPAEAAPPDVDDELEKWKREVEAAEEEVKRKKKGYVEPEPDLRGGGEGRAETPPEEEQEFTDDDGTVYSWDKGRKAWVPKEGLKEYNPEEMVFVPDEEVIPSLPAVVDTAEEESPEEEKPQQVGVNCGWEARRSRRQKEQKVPGGASFSPLLWQTAGVNTKASTNEGGSGEEHDSPADPTFSRSS